MSSLRTVLTHLIFSVFLLLASNSYGETLKIVTTVYPPYQYPRDGKAKGLSAEIVQAILAKTAYNYRINFYPWPRAYKLAQTDSYTLIFNISRTHEREQLFQWIAPITPNNIYLWKLRSRKDIQLTTLQDARGYRFGVLADDVKRYYLQSKGIAKKQLNINIKDQTNLLMLKNKRFDLMPYDEIAFRYHMLQLGINPNDFERALHLRDISQYAYLAASLDTPKEVVLRLQQSFTELSLNGELDAIVQKYRHKMLDAVGGIPHLGMDDK